MGKAKSDVEELTTFDGHPLTVNQAQFIDAYLTCGNPKQAYIEAYPECKPEVARQKAHCLINLDYISEEINYRLKELRDDSIADASEIMRYFTKVMRGEIKDQFGLDAPLSERTKAAQELAKRQIDMANRTAQQNVETPEVRIVLDWTKGIKVDG